MKGHLRLPVELIWYIIAVVAGPLLIGLEFLVGAAAIRLSGYRVQGLKVNNKWVKISNSGFALTIVLAILEELMYRQLWGVILIGNLRLPIWGFLLISSSAYGFNHIYFGLVTFLQKVVSGVVFALLYVYSGGAILIPIIAHTLQNVIVLFLGRYRGNE